MASRSLPAPAVAPAARVPRAVRVALARPELLALLGLAAVLHLWGLAQNGWANEYYAAAVRSMAHSWHAFLYGSFDAAGVQTVDKPPLALWVQALSVRLFGFHALSILVPQALMGVAAVGLTYDLTRRRFGRAGGAVAGLVLAVTPIAVAISRHNNPDALLVLCSVAALWCVVRALEDGRTRWVALAGVAVGLGFEAKMGAALLVVPGLAAAIAWVAPRGRRAALRSLAAGGAALVAVGGAWPLLVALTPAADRPWVSGTGDNSILTLIFGYNGLGRLDGQAGGPQAAGRGFGGSLFGGDAGPLRLLNAALGGQAGWLLGFAAVAALGLLVATRGRRSDPRTGWLLAAGGAFLATAVAFSAAQGIFHPYYVSALAPFTAALVGAGAAEIRRGDRLARILGPAAVIAGIATELAVAGNVGGLSWIGAALALAAIAAVALAAPLRARVRLAALGAALALLLAAPASWAVDTLGHATNGTFPAGGPATAGMGGAGGPGGFGGRRGFAPPAGGGRLRGAPPAGPGGAPPRAAGVPAGGIGGGGMFGSDAASLRSVVAYAKAHGGGTIGVSSQSTAAASIIASGADVAGLGSFSGREGTVSTSWLAAAVRDGRIRWVLDDGGMGGGMANDGRAGTTALMRTVASTCTAARGATSSSSSAAGTLYDCSGTAAALAAAG
jgi:4-amino-4-deoxy-L-arabinose transferase-like glycosyltransferase